MSLNGVSKVAILPIVVADRHAVMRTGIRTLLEGHPYWHVVAEAGDGKEAIEQVKRHHPLLTILDINLPVLNGLEVARQIAVLTPVTRILMYTTTESQETAQQAIHAGAQGYLLKTDKSCDLILACETVLRNEIYLTQPVARLTLDSYIGEDRHIIEDTYGLTGREREVVQLIAEGNTTREVAHLLEISVKTAETHRSNLMRKTGSHSVIDLVRHAIKYFALDLSIPRRQR